MPAKKNQETPVPQVEKSKAQLFADFVRDNKITLTHTYTLSVKDSFKDLVHPAVLAAIQAGVIEASISLQVK